MPDAATGYSAPTPTWCEVQRGQVRKRIQLVIVTKLLVCTGHVFGHGSDLDRCPCSLLDARQSPFTGFVLFPFSLLTCVVRRIHPVYSHPSMNDVFPTRSLPRFEFQPTQVFVCVTGSICDFDMRHDFDMRQMSLDTRSQHRLGCLT
ncbi:hypothetical protein RSAG8_01930, partial [Rhizoctonia solani AG-8 WAC10335]